MKTNLKLVEFAEKALKEDWGYCLGTFGNILTPTLLQQKMKQGYGVGAYNTKNLPYLKKYTNKRVSDCYGLVKAFKWWNGEGKQPSYIASQDRNQEGAFKAAKEKGPLSNLPEIPGLVLWMKGHAGIYIGNGDFIECAGAPKGMVKGKIINGRVAKGSPFTHWFKDTYITYVGPIKPTQPVGPVKQHRNIKVSFLGQSLIMNGIFHSDTNYVIVDGKEVKLRSLFESMGFKVGWNQNTQTILVSK